MVGLDVVKFGVSLESLTAGQKRILGAHHKTPRTATNPTSCDVFASKTPKRCFTLTPTTNRTKRPPTGSFDHKIYIFSQKTTNGPSSCTSSLWSRVLQRTWRHRWRRRVYFFGVPSRTSLCPREAAWECEHRHGSCLIFWWHICNQDMGGVDDSGMRRIIRGGGDNTGAMWGIVWGISGYFTNSSSVSLYHSSSFLCLLMSLSWTL